MGGFFVVVFLRLDRFRYHMVAVGCDGKEQQRVTEPFGYHVFKFSFYTVSFV